MATLLTHRSTRLVGLVFASLALAACGDKAPATDTTKAPPPTPAATAPAAAPATAATPAAPDSFSVSFETSAGTFVVQLNRAWSPKGVDRFYDMVNKGYFTNVRFFRVVPGFIAQFGMHPDPKVNDQWRERTIDDEPVVQSNKRGTIVFAKRPMPNSRANQFFINLADNGPSLDGQGFSAIGRVVGDGMTVVDKIYSGYGEQPDQMRVGAEGNAYLTKTFPKLDYIKTAKVVK